MCLVFWKLSCDLLGGLCSPLSARGLACAAPGITDTYFTGAHHINLRAICHSRMSNCDVEYASPGWTVLQATRCPPRSATGRSRWASRPSSTDCASPRPATPVRRCVHHCLVWGSGRCGPAAASHVEIGLVGRRMVPCLSSSGLDARVLIAALTLTVSPSQTCCARTCRRRGPSTTRRS